MRLATDELPRGTGFAALPVQLSKHTRCEDEFGRMPSVAHSHRTLLADGAAAASGEALDMATFFLSIRIYTNQAERMSASHSSSTDNHFLVQPRRIPVARSIEDRAFFQSQQVSSALLGLSDDLLRLVLRRLDTPSLARTAATCGYLYYPIVGLGATLTEQTMHLAWEQRCRDPCWTPVACSLDACFFVSGSRLMSCADRDWSANELGRPSDYENLGIPTRLPSFKGVPIQGIVATDTRRVAFSVSGDVYTWGDTQGLLGHGLIRGLRGEYDIHLDLPKQVEALAGIRITAVATGAKHILAVSECGQVFSWGNDSFGQCGIGGTKRPFDWFQRQTNYLLPRHVVALQGTPVRIASASGFHSLVVTWDGRLYAFGRNFHGQLGVGQNGLPPNGLSMVGEEEMHLLRDSDKWGTDDVVCYADEHLPMLVVVMEEGVPKQVRTAATGRYHSLAVTDDGNVFSWGSNRYGQLGLSDTTSYELEPHPEWMVMSLPTKVAGLQSIRTVVASEKVSGAVSDTGDLFTWGHGYGEMLGHREHDTVRTPRQVDGIDGVVAVAFGASHTIIVTRDCSVFSIGYSVFIPTNRLQWPPMPNGRYDKMMQLIP